MEMKTQKTLLTTLLLCGVPAVALANPVSPLVLGYGGHMLIGNLIIGVFEGLLLAWLCGLQKLRAIAMMVLANFFSAIAGIWFLEWISPGIAIELHNAWFWVLTAVAATFLMALVLEFPFFCFALRRTPNRFRRSIYATLKIQTISYVLLFGGYCATGHLTILTDLTLVEPSSLPLPAPVAVYYIATADGDVHRLTPAHGEPSFVYDMNASHGADCLWTRPSAADSNRWDLMASTWIEGAYSLSNVNVVVAESFATTTVSNHWQVLYGVTEAPPNWLRNDGAVDRLGDARDSPWSFLMENWARRGMRASRTDTGTEFRVAFEMPLGDWRIRDATHLPGDYVLFQLGRDQICIFDPMQKRIALVARGRGPVAVLED